MSDITVRISSADVNLNVSDIKYALKSMFSGSAFNVQLAEANTKVKELESLVTAGMDLETKLHNACQELSETKDYCNSIWELVKMFIPMCPAKSIVMLDKAMADGKALREKYKSEVEKERDTLQAKVKELESQATRM